MATMKTAAARTTTTTPETAPAKSSAAGVVAAGLAALVAFAASAYLAVALAVTGFGPTSTALIAGSVVGAAAAALPWLVALKLVSPAAARLRVGAEIAFLAVLVAVLVAPGAAKGALATRGAWPVELVGRDAKPMRTGVDGALALIATTGEPGDAAERTDVARAAEKSVRHEPRKLTPKEVFTRAAPAVVVIDVRKQLDEKDPLERMARAMGIEVVEGQGSGFFVAPNLVVTNDHVVDHATSLRVRTKAGAVKDASVVAIDPKNDLALLDLGATKSAALHLADQSADIGDDAIAIGSPLGLEDTLTTGVVSAHRALDGTQFLQIQTTIAPGSSGGPLLDDHGRVIGVTTATRGAGLNLAVDVAHVRALLEAKREPHALLAWVDDPIVLASLEFGAGEEPLPTTRAGVAEVMKLLGKQIESCVNAPADITIKGAHVSGAPDDKTAQCIATHTALVQFVAPQVSSVSARFHRSASGDLVVTITS